MIRSLRNLSEPFFQLFTFILQPVRSGVPRDLNRIAEDKDPAAERNRNQKTVPGLKDFFLEALKVKGTIGNPVSIASFTTPG